jgi:arylsulfatase I/J
MALCEAPRARSSKVLSLRHCPLSVLTRLFSGGTKVDAFVYSPLLPAAAVGTSYAGLMHVSDWLPTLLGLAGVSFSARDGYALDGVDQSAAIRQLSDSPPRSHILYNMYVNVSSQPTFDMYTNVPVAVRDGRYKLLHAFVGNPTALWYDFFEERANDDDLGGYSACSQTQAMTGTYTLFLFDLQSDPYETTNLFGQPELADIQVDCVLSANNSV